MNVSKEAREACAAYASPSTYQPGDGEKYGESLPLCQAFAKFEAEITQRVRDEALEEAAKGLDRLYGRVLVPCPDGIKGCLVAHFKIERSREGDVIRQMIGGKA